MIEWVVVLFVIGVVIEYLVVGFGIFELLLGDWCVVFDWVGDCG